MEGIDINIGNPFVADNDRFKMRPALGHMVDSAHLDVCTAFLDAYGTRCVHQRCGTIAG